MSSPMELREKKASASRAFGLSKVLHQLTDAQQRFQVTHQITEPAVKRSARKWKRMAQIKIKERKMLERQKQKEKAQNMNF